MIQLKRPHFYKYVTAEVAKLICSNRKVRYSAPRLFNDPFDSQIDLRLPFEFHDVRELMMQRFPDAVKRDTPLPNVDNHPHAMVLELFRCVRHRIPMSEDDLKTMILPAIDEGIQNMPAAVEVLYKELERLNAVKVFCVSEIHDNLLMWSHYAQNHTGAVIKFLCLPHLDNALCAASKVTYQKEFPVVVTLDELLDSAFGFRPHNYRLWDKLFLVKYSDWAYEQEWRVVLGEESPHEDFKDFLIHPEEIDKIFFGCRISDRDRNDILELLKFDLQHVKTFQAKKNCKQFALDFVPLNKPP